MGGAHHCSHLSDSLLLFFRASHLTALWQRPAGVLLHPWSLERGRCESPLLGASVLLFPRLTSSSSSAPHTQHSCELLRSLRMAGVVATILTSSSIPTLTSPTHGQPKGWGLLHPSHQPCPAAPSTAPSPSPPHTEDVTPGTGKFVPRDFQRLCSHSSSLGRSQLQVDASPSRVRCGGRK